VIAGLILFIFPTSARAVRTRWKFGSDYAAATLMTFGFGLETTKRKEGLRRLGLVALTATISSLKALRLIVAALPLWCRSTLLPRN
jgi:hypothetical protein